MSTSRRLGVVSSPCLALTTLTVQPIRPALVVLFYIWHYVREQILEESPLLKRQWMAAVVFHGRNGHRCVALRLLLMWTLPASLDVVKR